MGDHGVMRNYEDYAIPILEKDNTILTQIISRDTTERKKMERSLTDSNKMLLEACNLAHIGGWTWQIESDYVAWTDELYKIAGIDPKLPAPTYAQHPDLYTPESFSALNPAVEKALKTGESYDLELELIRPDGSMRIVDAFGGASFDSNRRIIGLYGLVQDITEQKRIEHDLQKSEQKYKALVETTADFVWEMDSFGCYTYCSPQMEALWGLNPKEMLGKTPFDLLPSEARAEAIKAYSVVLKFGKRFDKMEMRSFDGRGRLVYLEIGGVPFFDKEGKLCGYRGITRDITKRKKAEFEKQSILETTIDGYYLVDQHGNMLDTNNAYCKMIGYSREELLDMKVKDIEAIDTQSDIEDRIRRILETGSVIFETKHKRKDGSVIDIEASVSVSKEYEGRLVVFMRDITQRKLAEKEKKATEESLQKMQRLESLGVLAGGIAHDFNNLLASIFGYVEVAYREASLTKIKDYLSKVMKSMDRASGLTNQLLTFAQGGSPKKEITSMPPLIKEVIQFATSGSNVVTHFDIPDGLWQCEVDKAQIGQVLQNLIINAVQAMPMGGKIAISAKNVIFQRKDQPTLKEGKYVLLSIKDGGIGIPKDMLPRIFEPFFTTKTIGHGLGLAVSYSIVKKHDGAIDVESELGKGTTFQVYLPACDETAIEKGKAGILEHKGTGRILVMDDEEDIRNLSKLILEELGYSVECTTNGKQAIDFYLQETNANRPIDAIILDLTIPGGIGGKEVVKEIRKLNAEIPIFVVSGYSNDPIMANPQVYGFTASIGKPFTQAELTMLLEKHMKKGK
jgi:PAS domain S-box-containing protein